MQHIRQKIKHERLQRVYDQQQRPGTQIYVDKNQRCPTHHGSKTQQLSTITIIYENNHHTESHTHLNQIAHRAWCTRWALTLLSEPWFIEWPDELDQGHLWFNQCEPRSMHNDCTRWYTEWIQQVHQNELNPPIQLSLYVNRLNVTYKPIITSHFYNRTSDMRVTSTWSWSTTRRI